MTERPFATASARSALRIELFLVLGLSLGMSALRALVTFLGALTGPKGLSGSSAVLNPSFAPGRPWLDLSLQSLALVAGVLPAFLALYLLSQSQVSTSDIGLKSQQSARDLQQGWLLAAVIGIPGLLLYLLAHALGTSADIVASDLPAVWWRIPILILSALQNAVLEEIVVVAYLLTRLRSMGWTDNRALFASSALRGGYHLYQGLSGLVGNFVLGVIFGRFFQRAHRVLPLIIAHTTLDVVAFVGYTALHGHVSWLP